MAAKDQMEAFLWLTSTAKDLLRTVSKAMRGAVPCKAADLAAALEKEDISEGPLANADVKKAFIAEVKAKGGDISDEKVAALIEALGKVLTKEVEGIQKKAKDLKGKLPKQKKGEEIPGYKALAPLQTAKDSKVLGADWLVWHSSATGFDGGKAITSPPEDILSDRSALVSCCPNGPAATCAVALHTLENLPAYIKWELSIPGSKPPKAGVEVKNPFDDKMANEVAMRRALTNVFAPEVAVQALAEAGNDASKVGKALQKLAGDARKQTVIPMYVAPPAPKETKVKENKGKDGKGQKGGDDGAKAAPAPAGGAKAAPAPAGDFTKLHAATATQELQWHLLAYRLNPGTTLSQTSTAGTGGAAAAAAPAAAAAGAGKPAAKGGANKAGAASNKSSKAAPTGFQGTWQVGQNGTCPPGHTSVSWTSQSGSGSKAFQNVWSTAAQLPPGHTETSWGTGSSAPAAPAASAPAKAAKKEVPAKKEAPAKEAAKASPKAKPAAAPVASGDVEALLKSLGDEIRSLKEKLKNEGLSGKKLNEHPELKEKVAKLQELKSQSA